ncbi:MAG TPA: flagellar export protein FliJ [Macromonas sp.]|nr:flagellar export protein FliJ [Macromonas sp.]
MKKPTSLHTVVEVCSQKRDEALQALGHAQRELQQAQQQMLQLQGYAQESQQRWSQRAAVGVSPSLLFTHRQFMAKLEHAVTFQNGVLQRLQLNIDHCKHQVMQAERELAGLNKYVERRDQQWQHQLHRQEQRRNDEMAANLHRQSTSSTSWRHST